MQKGLKIFGSSGHLENCIEYPSYIFDSALGLQTF